MFGLDEASKNYLEAELPSRSSGAGKSGISWCSPRRCTLVTTRPNQSTRLISSKSPSTQHQQQREHQSTPASPASHQSTPQSDAATTPSSTPRRPSTINARNIRSIARDPPKSKDRLHADSNHDSNHPSHHNSSKHPSAHQDKLPDPRATNTITCLNSNTPTSTRPRPPTTKPRHAPSPHLAINPRLIFLPSATRLTRNNDKDPGQP